MNFQTVRQANGAQVVINATATQIDGTSFIPSGTAKQNCKFTDANGEQQSVTIWQGNGEPIPLGCQSQTLSINISSKTDRGRTYYGGFWQSGAQVPQRSQGADIEHSTAFPSQISPPQAPQQPPQATKPPPQQRNSREVSIERQAAFKAACEYCGRRDDMTPRDIIEVAAAGHYFIETSKNLYDIPMPDKGITNPGYVGDNPPPSPDDDIPF